MDTTWDVIIIGGGIAGLETCRKILTARPKARVLVLEKYNYLGGRMVTFKGQVGSKKVSWEIGAGRVCHCQTLIRNLIKEMGCHLAPTSPDMKFVENGCLRKNLFEPTILSAFDNLPRKELANSTLWDLTCSVWGQEAAARFWAEFPYDSEVRVLRADLGLMTFKREMASNTGISICVEGFSEVCRRMGKWLRSHGATIFLGHDVLEVRSGEVVCRHNGQEVIHSAKKMVVAVHSTGLRHIRGFKGWDLLNKLSMRPLVRIYGVFPLNQEKKMWFEGLGKVVTNTATRYFIPINEKKGIAMISYTDGRDAEKFLKMGDTDHGQEAVDIVMRDLRELFTDRNIPDPEMWRVHGWSEGCTYWVPGDYDPFAESRAAHTSHGIPGVYVVGESFSMRQAWIEGALEHVEQLWLLHGREIIHDKLVRGGQREH